MALVGSTKVVGVEVEIHASKGGEWQVRLDDKVLARGKDLEKAERAAGAALRKARVKVEVPFFTIEGTPGIATGIHAANRSVLAKIDGESQQLSGYGVRGFLSGDTPPDVIERLRQAKAAARTAEAQIAEIIREHSIDLRGTVDAAINAKTPEAD